MRFRKVPLTLRLVREAVLRRKSGPEILLPFGAIERSDRRAVGVAGNLAAYSTEPGHPVQSKLDSRSVATRGLFFTPDGRVSSNLFYSF